MDSDAIRSAVDQFIAAYNRSDVDALLSIYADDLVKLRHRAEPESKRETEERLRSFFETNRGHLSVQNDELIVSGDVAFTRGSLIIVTQARSGGEPQTIRRRFVELWRKEGGRWKVARTMDAEI